MQQILSQHMIFQHSIPYILRDNQIKTLNSVRIIFQNAGPPKKYLLITTAWLTGANLLNNLYLTPSLLKELLNILLEIATLLLEIRFSST